MRSSGEEAEADKVRQVRAEQRSTFALAEKKLQLINEAHDLVDRQIARLDTELEKVHNDLGFGKGNFGEASGNGLGMPLLAEPEPEPPYCVCGQGSFGDMVCCDNPICAIEWFHFDCVGLRTTPEGTWLCPMCVVLRRSNLKLAGGVKLPSAMRDGSEMMGGVGESQVDPDDPEGYSRRAIYASARGFGRGRGRARGSARDYSQFKRGRGRGRGTAVGRGNRGTGKGQARGSGGGGEGGDGGDKPAASHKRGRGIKKHPVKDCPACRGKHKAHTCGRGRNAMLARG